MKPPAIKIVPILPVEISELEGSKEGNSFENSPVFSPLNK